MIQILLFVKLKRIHPIRLANTTYDSPPQPLANPRNGASSIFHHSVNLLTKFTFDIVRKENGNVKCEVDQDGTESYYILSSDSDKSNRTTERPNARITSKAVFSPTK